MFLRSTAQENHIIHWNSMPNEVFEKWILRLLEKSWLLRFLWVGNVEIHKFHILAVFCQTYVGRNVAKNAEFIILWTTSVEYS